MWWSWKHFDDNFWHDWEYLRGGFTPVERESRLFSKSKSDDNKKSFLSHWGILTMSRDDNWYWRPKRSTRQTYVTRDEVHVFVTLVFGITVTQTPIMTLALAPLRPMTPNWMGGGFSWVHVSSKWKKSKFSKSWTIDCPSLPLSRKINLHKPSTLKRLDEPEFVLQLVLAFPEDFHINNGRRQELTTTMDSLTLQQWFQGQSINQLDRSQDGLVFPSVALFFTFPFDDYNLLLLEGVIFVGVGEMTAIHCKISSTWLRCWPHTNIENGNSLELTVFHPLFWVCAQRHFVKLCFMPTRGRVICLHLSSNPQRT
jgi:hypothetical protein